MIAKLFSKIPARFLLAAVVLSLAASSLRAEEKTWTGASDASWLNGGNWFPSALLPDVDSVLYDSSSTANLSQTLDQGWAITGLKVTTAAAPITISPGASSFVLTNAGGIDMSVATADLTILASYRSLNNGTLNVAAGRTLTLSNTVAVLTTATAMNGSGTIRILGSAQRTDQFNGITVIADGGKIEANQQPVRLNADPGSTVTVIVTNNGAINVTGGNAMRIHLGNANLADGTNHFILDGGSVRIEGSLSSSANGIYVGSGLGTVGILDINNGTIDMSDRNGTSQYSVLRLGNALDSRGIVNLNAGGRLLTPRIDRIDGHAIFNFNGGYLETTAARADYFDLVDEVNLLAGGAFIDTGARLVSVVAPLSGSGALTKLGTGTLTLAATPTYTGATVISNGTLAVTLPMASSSLALSNTAALNLGVSATPDTTWSVSELTLGGSNALTFTYGDGSQPSTTLIDTATLNAADTNVINIAGTGWPMGTIRLIDYTGSIIGGGTFVLGTVPLGLNVAITNNPTTSSIDLVVSPAPINNLDWWGYFAGAETKWDIATSSNWNNGTAVYKEYGSGTNDVVRFTSAGNPTVDITTTVRPSSVTVSNSSSGLPFAFVGSGKISGATSLIKEGDANSTTLTISTVNDYTGGTFIRMGNLILGADNALPTPGLVYVGSPLAGASFILNGFNQTIGGLISAGSGGGNRRVLNNSATPSILTINVVANQTNNYAHTTGHNNVPDGDVANNFSVVKTGPGIQALENSFYEGTTTISGGTLLFNGNATTLIGPITVQAGGAIGGNGTGINAIGAPVLVENGGRLEPGNLGIGTMTVSNSVTLQGEAVMQINRTNAPTGDRLVANAVTLGGTLTVTNLGEALQDGNTFTLFSGTLSGGFNSVVLPALSSGLVWNTNNLTANGTISVAALPRPTFVSPTLSGNNLILSGTGGPANGTYHVLTSTDIALPLTNWTTLATNTFDGSGAFSFTNAVNPASPQQFFTLQVP